MKVRALIKKLQRCDPDAEVHMQGAIDASGVFAPRLEVKDASSFSEWYSDCKKQLAKGRCEHTKECHNCNAVLMIWCTESE